MARISSTKRQRATAWNGRSTSVDRLIRDGKVRPTIVVGVWNTPKRLQEYVPAKAFRNYLPQTYRDQVRDLYGGDPLSDGYLKFIVRELKPMIDRRFNVKVDRANTVDYGLVDGCARLPICDR